MSSVCVLYLIHNISWQTLKIKLENICSQCPCPHGEPQPAPTSVGGPPTLAGRETFKMAEEYDVEINFLPTNTSEIYLHVEQLLQNTYWTLAEDLRPPKSFSFFLPFFLPFLLSCVADRVLCSGRVWGLCLWGGRAKFRTLIHQRPPGSM